MKRAVRRLTRLRSKILLYIGVPVLALLAAVVASLGTSFYHSLYDDALARIRSEAVAAAGRIDTWNLETVTVARVMGSAQENGLFGNRRASLAYAHDILKTYPQFTGAYFGYEPNADGKDAAFLQQASADDKLAADASGRFIPYWFRDKQDTSKVVLAPLIDMDTSFYYQGLRNRIAGRPEDEGVTIANGLSAHFDPARSTLAAMGKTMVTEPYLYEGKLIVEQAYPITIEGRFAGIAGVDRALDEIDNFIKGRKPYATAEFVLISHRGRVISATMDAALKTQPIEKTPFAGVLLPFYSSRTDADVREVTDAAGGGQFLYTAAKVPTGDWTLVMRVAKSEIVAPVWSALRRVMIVSLVGLVLGVVLLGFVAGSVARPIGAAAQVASRVADGDLTVAVDAAGSDEIGTLFRSIRSMIANLNGLVGQVKSSSILVTSTATRISAAAAAQEASVSDFGASTSEIAAASNEISVTSRELVKTMGEVSGMMTETAELAGSGHTSLDEMQDTMGTLAAGARSIAANLSVIRENAGAITTVVTTITKVADQTNLLSLNAAIEATKAGEFGHGFSVVAREIRRLADQTAVATLDIERMVGQMQASVSTGVVEMERFSDQVQRSVTAVERVSEQLAQIIDRVQALTPRFESVTQGMRAQSTGAGQISTAMVNLTGVARTTSASVVEFNAAAGDLREAIRGLRDEVSRFKVEGAGSGQGP